MRSLQDSRFLAVTGALVLIAGVLAPARAQDPDDQRRGVARISVINGDVSVRRGDSGDWVAAAQNAPLVTEDRLATGPNSRAEVQFDASNVLRIGGNAEIRLTQLEYGRYQMEVAHGTITYTVLRPSNINVEVDTPSVSVRPARQGVYRISVSDAGETQVISRAGEVEVFTPRGSEWVRTGQMLLARGTGGDPEFQIVSAIPLDDWDRWNQSRDQVMTKSVSSRYVPPGVYGAEDLDQYGDWVDTEEYGRSWRPRVAYADWSPYSVGRWAWEDWYGWTWISADPWGWAPYHYGRWFNEPRYGWCWYPGAFGSRHYWSPALVAWFGFGGGGGFGFGFGNVGWVPLAPHESYNRWWGRGYYGGDRFNRNINITNVNIYNTYRNARVRNGIAGVAEGDFRSGRFNNVGRYSGDQVREAGLVRGQIPIAPTSEHLRYSDRNVARAPRTTGENARMFTHQRPNPVERTPFAQQQRGLEQNFRSQQPASTRTESPGRFGSQPRNGDIQNRGGEAPNRFGSQPRNGDSINRGATPGALPGSRTPEIQPRTESRPSPNSGNSWRRFGDPSGQNPAPGNSAPRMEGGFGRGAAAPNRSFENNRENMRPETPVRNQAPSNRGDWQRFGSPGNAPRQQGLQDNPRNESPRLSQPPRGEPQSIRTAPPVVRERQNEPAMRYNSAPRSYSQPSYNPPPERQQPSYRQPSYSPPPRQEAPRGFGGGPSRQEAPRGFSSPAPRQEAPRGFGGGGGGGMSSPRQSGGNASPSPRSSGGGDNRSSDRGNHGGPRGGGRRE